MTNERLCPEQKSLGIFVNLVISLRSLVGHSVARGDGSQEFCVFQGSVYFFVKHDVTAVQIKSYEYSL